MAESILMLKYHEWKAARSLISPSFATGKLKAMTPIFSDAVKILLENIDKFALTEKPINICPFINSAVFDMVARACFAAKVDAFNDIDNTLVKKARLLFGGDRKFTEILAMVSPTLMKLFNITTISREATDFLADLSKKNIQDRLSIKNISSNQRKYQDLIQYLLDANDEGSDSKKQSELVASKRK